MRESVREFLRALGGGLIKRGSTDERGLDIVILVVGIICTDTDISMPGDQYDRRLQIEGFCGRGVQQCQLDAIAAVLLKDFIGQADALNVARRKRDRGVDVRQEIVVLGLPDRLQAIPDRAIVIIDMTAVAAPDGAGYTLGGGVIRRGARAEPPPTDRWV